MGIGHVHLSIWRDMYIYLLLCYTKVEVPNSITSLDHTPILELCVVRCGSMSGYHKDMWFEEKGLHAQNMIPIIGSIFNKIE